MDKSAVIPDIFHGLETELKLSACFYRTPLFCLSALFSLELLGEATQRLGAMEFFHLETVFSCVVIFCSPVSFRCLCNLTKPTHSHGCGEGKLLPKIPPSCCFYPQCYYSSLILGGTWGFSHMLTLFQDINSSPGRWLASL